MGYDLLQDEDSISKISFQCNRDFLIESFKYNRLFIIEENDKKLSIMKSYIVEKFKLPHSRFTFPCFIVFDENMKLRFIWTHPNVRRCHLAMDLIIHFSITKVDTILRDSSEFWDSMNVIWNNIK